MDLKALAIAILTSATVEAAEPLGPLQVIAEAAARTATVRAAEREASRQAVVDRFGDVTRAEDALMAARNRERFDDRKLAAAMDALARGKATYDATLTKERAAIVGSVQADAATRAARQSLKDAAVVWASQGEALQRATTRAQAGEFAPSATRYTACLDTDCSPIAAQDHAAMIAIGAVGPAFETESESQEALHVITVLPPGAATVRTLRDAANTAATTGQRDAEDVTAHRKPLFAVVPPWDTAVQNMLDVYFRPQANSHAEELLTMAADDLSRASNALRSAGQSYRSASLAADASAATRRAAEEKLSRALTIFADQGRAISRAAVLAERGYILSSNGSSLCREAVCQPASGLEAAAFLVIGAAAPAAEKSLGALIEPTADKRWVFRRPAS